MRSSTWRLEDLRNVILNLGFVGENLHTRQIFDCKKMFDQYPNASVSMTVTPPEGEPYPGTIERDGDLVIWDVKDSDLVAEGDGEIQLVFTQEPHIARSYNARTHICRSQVPTGSIPSGLDDYITRADQLLDQVEDTFPAGGTTGQVLAKKSDTDYDTEWVDQGGGTEDYDELENRPQIGGVTLTGNKTLHDLGAASEADVAAKYTKPATGIPASDLAAGVIPDPEDLIDDEAGAGDTDKVWSADKSHAFLTEINSAEDEVSDLSDAVASLDFDINGLQETLIAEKKVTAVSGSYISEYSTRVAVDVKSGAEISFIIEAPNGVIPSYYLYQNGSSNYTVYYPNVEYSITLAADLTQLSFYVANATGNGEIDFKAYAEVINPDAVKSRLSVVESDVENLEDSVVSKDGTKEVETKNLKDVSTNVIFELDEETVSGSGQYVYKTIHNYNGELSAGDSYCLYAKSIVGATADNRLVAILYAGNTEIKRSGGDELHPVVLTITDADITANADKIEFDLYPAAGTALPTGSAIYTGIKISKDGLPSYAVVGNLKNAIFGGANTEVPDYWHTNHYLSNKADRINELANAGDDVFFFITDVHWLMNAQHSPAIIKYLSQKCNINRLFDGGDISQGTFETMKPPVDEFRDAYKGRIYRVAGNHDWFAPATGKAIYYGFNGGENNDQIGNVNEHYWYTDNVQAKIRYVVLNTFKLVNGTWEYGFNQTQVDWFTNEALDVPDGYDVIVFAHYFRETTGYSGYTDIESAIASFNADTTSHGKVLCIIQGHTHYDAVFETSSGVPVVITTCDKWDFSNEPEWQETPRTKGNISEQAFDVVVVNRASKNIHFVRIGYPAQDNVEKKIGDTGFTFIGTLEERTISYL